MLTSLPSETILQPAVSAGSEGAKAIQTLRPTPYPLPLSRGLSGELMMKSDLEMSAALNALERTPKQFASILDQAGLKIIKIVQPRAPHGIVEAMLKDA